MRTTFYCDKCRFSIKCDDEDIPDECPNCGYDGQDDSTIVEPDFDPPDDDDRDDAAEWGGVDMPDARF